ncbi:Rid family detoxifying hydrolase [Bradyrhizobium sp. LA2.1]|uniref:Rid family detoxifying hydrolase n=1 Tax=Bradyrhizobium sp. LA2.1 TaxID=3156376 RepID=UPI00339A1C6B
MAASRPPNQEDQPDARFVARDGRHIIDQHHQACHGRTALSYWALVIGFEKKISHWDAAVGAQLVAERASWEETRAAIGAMARHQGLMILTRINQGEIASWSGTPRSSSLYLVGNPIIATDILSEPPQMESRIHKIRTSGRAIRFLRSLDRFLGARIVSTRHIIVSPSAPAPVGPYSQAISAQGLVYVSGQLPIDAVGGNVPDGIEAQTRQSLRNLLAVLDAAGSDVASVVKTTVFLKNMSDFGVMNTIYADVFGSSAPARSTIEVSRLPRDVLVEIECVALATKRTDGL